MERSEANLVAASRPAEDKAEQVSVILLFLLAVGCYANTLWSAFVYDDELQILQNPYVKSWKYLPEIFRSTVWSFIGTAGESNYYRPLMTLTYLGLWKIFGNLPIGFHLFNLLVNGFVVICVYYAGRQLLGDRWAAVVAAALFAVHPIHTETVAWIAAVPDLEATLFFLIGFNLYIKVPQHGWKRPALVVLCLLLALLAKEPALMLVPVLMFYEHFVREGRTETPFIVKVRRYAPMCIAGAGYLLLRIALFGKLAPVLQHAQITWPQAIYSGFALVSEYCRLLFWPTRLSAFHVFHASTSLGDPHVLPGVAVVAASAILALLVYKRWPVAAFCLVWIGITLLPVLNARWMASNVLTERYLYLPSVGFCWLIAYAGKGAWDRAGERAALRLPLRAGLCSGLALLLVLGSTHTWSRNRVWHDDTTLYTTTLETDPDSWVVEMNLGVLSLGENNYPAAEKQLGRALELKPGSANILNALGCLYIEEDRLEDAAKTLDSAIESKPLWTDAHFNKGRVLQKLGRNEEALAEFRAAVRLGPVNANAALFLAEQLEQMGNLPEAEAQYRRSIQLAPSLTAQKKLANLLVEAGRDAEAQVMLRQLVLEYPFDSAPHKSLGVLYERAGRTDEAIKEYRTALETDPTDKESIAALKRLAR